MKRIMCLISVITISNSCIASYAIVREPANSVERFESERAYSDRAAQRDVLPTAAPPPASSVRQQSDATNNIMQVSREKSPQDIGALQTVQKDIRMQNPAYRVLRVAGSSILVLAISALVIWQLWKRVVAGQRKKLLEEMQKGQQLARELRDRR